jgi:RND family efflux transporter MFP subunit
MGNMSVGRCGRRVPGRSAPTAGLLLLFAAGCSSPAAPKDDVVRPVKTVVVTAGEEPHVRSFPGKVEASRKAELAFQVSGLLANLPVKEGQKVAKGEVVAQLRPDEFQARLKSLQGQLDQARAALRALQAGERPEERLRRESQVRATEARLTNARSEMDRMNRLQSAVSRAEIETAETAYRVAQADHTAAVQLLEKATVGRQEDIEAREAEVRGLEARVVEADLQLKDSTLHAPYDGVIAQRFVEANQNVAARQPVVRFQDVDEIVVAADVPETVMATVLSADIVSLVAEVSGAPGVQFPVHIREVAQVADPTTQTFKIRTAMQAPSGVRVLPGMTATVTLTYRRASILGTRILVPVEAVAMTPAGEQVAWVMGADDTVAPRPVKLGAATGGRVEVRDGLRPGDRVVAAGVRFLREGMRVRDLGDALGGGQP